MKYAIYSEQDLLQAFRTRDRKHVEIPQKMKFPVLVKNYLTWTEPSGVRVFLVFKEPKTQRLLGVAFRRDQQNSQPSSASICDWCHSYGSSDEVGLLTATVDSKRRIGVNLCLNLECTEKLENLAQISDLNLQKRTDEHRDRMIRFAREGLEIKETS